MANSLVIKLTCGADRPETSNQALNVAATAIASGIPVSLWLAGEASWFAVPGRAEQVQLAHAAPFEALLATILAEGQVTLCTQCALRRGLQQEDLFDDVRIAGSATFVEEIMRDNVQAVVY